MIRREMEPKARKLRKAGLTFKQIANRLHVGERSVRRWLKDQPTPVSVPRGRPKSGRRIPRDWPKDRLWPADWTVSSLSDLPGFDRDEWEGNLGLIEGAQALENLYIPWYFRRMIETARRYQWDDPGKNHWLYAIAAAPVLADWLSVPEFTELGLLIERTEPWRGKQERKKYLGATKGLRRQVRNGIGRALILPPKSVDPLYPPAMLLRFLAGWQPVFDKPPLMARLMHVEIGQLVLLLLRNPKPEFGGMKA